MSDVEDLFMCVLAIYIALPTKVHPVRAMVFPVGHEKGCMAKNGCLHTVVLEKTPETPLDCKDIKQVNPKGNQP